MFLGVGIYCNGAENLLDNEFVSSRSICLHFLQRYNFITHSITIDLMHYKQDRVGC